MLRDKDEANDIALPSTFHKDTTYHIIWHFVDKAKNDKTCDQYLTVADTTPPDASDACKKLTDKTVVAENIQAKRWISMIWIRWKNHTIN